MSIFNPYIELIKKAVDNDPKRLNKLYGRYDDESLYDLSHISNLRNSLPSITGLNESVQFMKGIGAPISSSLPRLGSHPDFEYLRGTTDTENHWIISGFVDVKKSTQLFNQFSKATVALITEGIVKASIFAVNFCEGYVHRVQGDGLMVYFGGKNKDKAKATKNALKAFSIISYFVKNDLKDYFEVNGIKDIYTRAGIDLGYNNQVLWMYSGLGNAGEVTTCSLHTSLAPKMQAKALSNGIVVGQHVVNQLTSEKYFKKKPQPIWDYEDGRTYDHYDFNWEKYLVDNDIAVQDQYGKLLLDTHKPSIQKDATNLVPIATASKPYFE